MHHLQHISELAAVLERMGARQVLIAPGSRNAPLIQLFTSREQFHCHSIVDERSAGYVALGMARQTGEPVVVVTTSGTAVLNLSPAVAEAFHQHLPLVVLTADRPRETLPQFDNQVIDQRAPYYNHSKGFFEFPVQLRSPEELKRSISSVELLLQEALRGPQGPVHVNLPLAEPLYVALPEPMLALEKNTEGADDPERSYDPGLAGTASPAPWKKEDPRVLILAGMGRGSAKILKALENLVDRGQVAVVAENLSNLGPEQFITVPELILGGAGPDTLKDLAPDVVIAFGRQMVSKRMKMFVNSLDKAEILQIPEGVSVSKWLGLLAGNWKKPVENSYQRTWLGLQERESLRAAGYLEEAPYCNLVAVHRILQRVPRGTVVHLGNSTTIRYSQLFRARPGLTYCSNRGTSGIDGSLSAAVGAAMVSGDPHLLLLGDLSFVYDSNAMWNKKFPENLKIVVLNDGGGGIFRLLEGPEDMPFFEEFSITHHPVSLELLSQSFGRSFLRVDGKEELDDRLDALFAEGSHLSVLEVDTTSAENSRIFKKLFS